MIPGPQNPFLSGIGPDSKQAPMPPQWGWSMEQRAREEAARQGMKQFLAQGSPGPDTFARPVGQGIGELLKRPVQTYLKGGANAVSPLAAQAGATALAPAGGVAGGQVPMVENLFAGAAPAAAAPSVLAQGAGVLGFAGLGYNAYGGIRSGMQLGSNLASAQRSGLLDQNQVMRLREKAARNAGTEKLVGMGTGALAGASAGSVVPVVGTAAGAIIGAALGGIGGEFKRLQAQRGTKGNTYVNYLKEKFKHPW